MSESKEAGTECHLKVKIEWLGGVQVNQTTRESVVAQRLNNGLLHQIEDAIGIGPARREPTPTPTTDTTILFLSSSRWPSNDME